ncbi:DUF5666 domain-containing protein [Actinomadura rubrisoli]|uniref:DUF5666 domain-containing protein n=1 Tax=Actinomadura rubrisoli TaxID=2530368 RepID=A0A4R5C586_9ACTN|nr:DUF5666 domain-containing protein [Actinomadura rubrisoli]TDD94165.1 hypothetical protein E1298_07630 [Actinomadura rubrisoli]
MRTDKKTLAAGVGAAGLLGLGLYLAVPAAAANPSPSPSQTSPGDDGNWRGKGHAHHGLRGIQGVHGEATVRRKDGFHLATWQRGQITARSGATLTVRSVDGASWTWTTDTNTRVRKDGAKSTVAALANGDQVLVMGERTNQTRTAKLVREPKNS